MVSSNGSLILPLVLWDNVAPDCQISSLIVSESEKYVFCGTTSGHIIMWDFNVDEVSKLKFKQKNITEFQSVNPIGY